MHQGVNGSDNKFTGRDNNYFNGSSAPQSPECAAGHNALERCIKEHRADIDRHHRLVVVIAILVALQFCAIAAMYIQKHNMIRKMDDLARISILTVHQQHKEQSEKKAEQAELAVKEISQQLEAQKTFFIGELKEIMVEIKSNNGMR